MEKQADIKCPICKRTVTYLDSSEHHLVPKSLGGKDTIRVCVPCGKMLHKLISLRDMERTYNTVESLLEHNGVREWAAWISRRPKKRNVKTATKKRR